MTKRLLTILVVIIVSALMLSNAYADSANNDSWILTQYYGGGSVGMFYSMVNPSDGTLILIDGGYTSNADQVRQVIEDNGGKVDYWFVTHYHEDHCGAFNALWPEYREKIGTVYVTPLTWEEFEPYCHDWDTPDTFRLYLQQTDGAENIVALHRGDEFNIGSLHFTVFNAWDDEVLPNTDLIANNCSLAFKVTNTTTSVMFFGDAELISPYLLEKYGAEALHADYVQSAHHGWGTPVEVYDAIKPGEMFIDATDDLLNSPDYADKHGVLVRWCEENGIPIHKMSDAPFSVALE